MRASRIQDPHAPSRRVRAAAVLFALALALASCSSSRTPKRPKLETFTIDGARTELPDLGSGVQLFAPIGNIWLRSSKTAWLEKSYSVSAADLEAALLIVKHATTEMRQVEGDLTLISMRPPEDCPFEALTADSVLALPAKLDVDLRSVGGLIDARSYSARNATLRTRDGNLIVGSVDGELRFETETGSVEIAGEARVVRGRTRSGSIFVATIATGASFELESKSADCSVVVPPLASLAVIHRSKTGSLRIDFDDAGVERRFVPRADGWSERHAMFRGAPSIAQAALLVFESEEGDLILTRPRPDGPRSEAPKSEPSQS